MTSILEGIFKAPEPQYFEQILSLQRTGKPNEAMIVPFGQSAPAKKRKLKIVEGRCYTLTASALLAHALESLNAGEDGVSLESAAPEHGAVLCIRTQLMRYPDMVYLHAIALGHSEAGATLGAYSHSVYGRSDFGVNLKRLTNLQDELTSYEVDGSFA